MDEDRRMYRETRKAAHAYEEQRKAYVGALNALLREEAKAAAATDHHLSSFVGAASVEEELEVLQERLSEHFQQSLMVYPSLSAAQQEAWLEVKQARSEAIRKWFHIAADGQWIPPPWYAQVLLGQTWQGQLVKRLEDVFAEQAALQETVGKLVDGHPDDMSSINTNSNGSRSSFLSDLILLQTFALEQVT
eukprot:gene20126-14690_t